MKHIGSIGIVIGFASLIMAPVVTAETSASNQPKPPVSTPQKPETTDAGTGTNLPDNFKTNTAVIAQPRAEGSGR
jgi:hypothetical protein